MTILEKGHYFSMILKEVPLLSQMAQLLAGS
eukprot:CAMPEP_0202950586 /NCGR_PEP_ID=MMETSP1395-20130829/23835_1 /ASSEMBLY_ACC=CAM_ASM_000871 /TAXON_ID=5961 /ORGANISM="Blepharisma japonicum, Strain Stock R1072" /LENGTH=30 /DNA_ID= /DNA_START= /DNA_END= /DNA_ORIENTATION=